MRRLLIPLLAVCVSCHAAPPCAGDIQGLRSLIGDAAFPLQWHETTMDDGKPLVLSILERNDRLFLSFLKTREGLWAEGAVIICTKGSRLEARFEKMTVGPGAHWAMRRSLANGADFILTRINATRMKIATFGWSGDFSARPTP